MGASRPDCPRPSRTQIKFCMHVSLQIGRAIGTTPRSMIASSLVICQSCRNPQPVDCASAHRPDFGTARSWCHETPFLCFGFCRASSSRRSFHRLLLGCRLQRWQHLRHGGRRKLWQLPGRLNAWQQQRPATSPPAGRWEPEEWRQLHGGPGLRPGIDLHQANRIH